MGLLINIESFFFLFLDIGANLTDPMYQGIYNGTQKHQPDLDKVLERSWNNNLSKIIITAGNLEESKKAVEIAKTDGNVLVVTFFIQFNYIFGLFISICLKCFFFLLSDRLFSTVGCHPTKCNEFEESEDPEAYLDSLYELAHNNKNKIIAIGEMGLDYDRLQFCSKEVQKKYFKMQLSLCTKLKLPMFLHCRNAAEDFVSILREHKDILPGVVHSFDGNTEDAYSILQLGLYIGINGW